MPEMSPDMLNMATNMMGNMGPQEMAQMQQNATAARQGGFPDPAMQ
jgi:hypothetical protein